MIKIQANITVNMLGSKSVKIVTICLLYLVAAFLGFILIFTYRYFVIVLLILLVYTLIFSFGIYIMIGTKRKLKVANLFFGICFLTLAIGFYAIFINNFVSLNVINLLLLIIAFLVLCFIIETILFETCFLSFKANNKQGNKAALGYFLGSAIGSFSLKFIREKFGDGAEFTYVIVILLFLFFLLLFSGVFFINKSYWVLSKRGSFLNIQYIEKL